jgi:hypothetical protein
MLVLAQGKELRFTYFAAQIERFRADSEPLASDLLSFLAIVTDRQMLRKVRLRIA